MKQLYIPTTTLNFNNILSSESISPKAFYLKRGFGYSRWFSIPENNLENSLCLYEKKFKFARPKGDLEDHPLLIEVFVNEESIKLVSNGVYICDHTLYLTPWNCNFYFFNESDKRITISMSETSLETKLVWLYSNHIKVDTTIEGYYEENSVSDVVLNDKGMELDIAINKMKGLLYGYYIGALLSDSVENVRRMNVLKNIHNISSSIISSLDKTPTDFQLETLKVLFRSLNAEKNAYKELRASFSDEQISCFLEVVSRYGNNLSPFYDYRKFAKSLADLNMVGENESILWVRGEINKQKYNSKSSRRPLDVKNNEILVAQSKMSAIKCNYLSDDFENKLFTNVSNKILIQGKYDKNISTYKTVIADEITDEAKFNVYNFDSNQEFWANSKAKVYLNKMRRYVNGENVEIEWDNSIYSSLIAVLSCENNWEKLLAFMQDKEMVDYRLAFAIYGELVGFANLTRDFTDIILSNNSSNYIAEFYQEIANQLLGNSIPKKDETMSNSTTTEKFSSGATDSMDISNIPTRIVDWFNNPLFNGGNSDWLMRKVYSICKGKKKLTNALFMKIADLSKDKEWISIDSILWNNSLRELDEKLYAHNFGVDKSVEGSSSVEMPETKETASLDRNFDGGTSFDNNHIDDILNFICTFVTITNEETKKYLKKDIKWSTDTKYSNSTEKMIEELRRSLYKGKNEKVSQYGKSMEWKNKLYADLDIDLIISKLTEKYVNTQQ